MDGSGLKVISAAFGNVQGWTAEDVSNDVNSFVPQQCIACRQIHYVNPNTGRVLGGDDADDE
jgi:hypothetical protein